MRRDALQEATAAEVEAGSRSARWRRRLRWWLKTVSLVIGIFTSAAKLWVLMKARDVGRAELPPGNDMATIATDRVERPKADE